MVEIKARYDQVENARQKVGGLAFFSGKYKKDREWHVLGAIQQLLIRAGINAPTHAQEHESPDFYTFFPDGERWASIEVVEVLRPDYKRQDSYKRAALPDSPVFQSVPPRLEQPWQPLREQIISKASKNYPNGTCLFVYYDIGRFSFNDWTTPFNDLLLTEHARAPFIGIDTFQRVLVLSSDMKSLVELYPTPTTIVPDRQ